MPEGPILDPRSVSAERDWRDGIERRVTSLKQSGQVNAPGYATGIVNQLGINAATAITGLTKTLVVGTRRLIRVTGQVLLLKHTTDMVFLYAVETTELGTVSVSVKTLVDTTAETGAVESVFAPSAGTRTFQIWVASNGATTVDSMGALLLPTIANWILVKDIGEAPA